MISTFRACAKKLGLPQCVIYSRTRSTMTPCDLQRPRGHYAKYKRATQHFLQWLWKVRGCGIGTNAVQQPKQQNKQQLSADDQVKAPLAIYDRVVTAIVREPRALTPSLLNQWTRALAACESSITLREQFSVYFPLSDGGQDGHAYFISQLRCWLTALRSVEITSPIIKQAREDVGGLNFANCYDVLSLADDFFGDELEGTQSGVQASVQSLSLERASSAMDPEALFAEAFATDLKMELASLLAELDELLESAYIAFVDVKQQKKTLLEAAAITKVAVDCALTVIAALQVRYPSVKTAEDLATMIEGWVPGLASMKKSVAHAWRVRPGSSPALRLQYARGTAVIDLLAVMCSLSTFCFVIPSDLQGTANDKPGCTWESYCEENTPYYVIPSEANEYSAFLLQQLPPLYNAMVSLYRAGVGLDTKAFLGGYIGLFESYFRSKIASVEAVVASVFWVRSVAALQGNVGVARSASLSLLHRWDLEHRLEASVRRIEVHRMHPSLLNHKERLLRHCKSTDSFIRLVRTNPIFACFALLDNQPLNAEAFCTAVFSLRLPRVPRDMWTMPSLAACPAPRDVIGQQLYPIAAAIWRQQVLATFRAIWLWRQNQMDPDTAMDAHQATGSWFGGVRSSLRELERNLDGDEELPLAAGLVSDFAQRHNAAPRDRDATDEGNPELGQQPDHARFILFFDGGSRGNPGPGGAGSVVVATDRHASTPCIVWAAATKMGDVTTNNNQAEYTGAAVGLQAALDNQWVPLEVVGGSQLIVSQLRDYRPPKATSLRQHYHTARHLADQLGVEKWSHHLRAFNKMADLASNVAMDAAASSVTRFPCAGLPLDAFENRFKGAALKHICVDSVLALISV